MDGFSHHHLVQTRWNKRWNHQYHAVIEFTSIRLHYHSDQKRVLQKHLKMHNTSSKPNRFLMPIPSIEKVKLEISEKEKDPALQKILNFSMEKERKAKLDRLRFL